MSSNQFETTLTQEREQLIGSINEAIAIFQNVTGVKLKSLEMSTKTIMVDNYSGEAIELSTTHEYKLQCRLNSITLVL